MQAIPASLPRSPGLTGAIRGFADWLRTHPGAVAMAGLLAFAAPFNFFVGSISVMREPSASDVMQLGLWWLLYGAELWVLLLAAGRIGERLCRNARRAARGAVWLSFAGACALATNLSTAGRAAILIEQGVVQGAATMHLYSFTISVTMALLYFAHLGRSRDHEAAAARLASAQAGQRQIRRRTVQIRLQAVQARIDPSLLFGMLESVRLAYDSDPVRAERLLGELIAFLRASLPRLRAESSSVAREAELARSYAQLLFLAQASDRGFSLRVTDEAMHARFPPGALLPLLDDALRCGVGGCALDAACVDGACQLALSLPARPSDGAVARVKALLEDIHGSASGLAIRQAAGRTLVKLWVPHEPA
jgi:hypothetical protein